MHSQTIRPHGIYIAFVLIAVLLPGGTGLGAEAAGNAGDSGDTGNKAEAVRHVRTIDLRLHALLVEGARRSPSFRKLVDPLNHSTVVVYTQSGLLSGNLSGRLTFVGSGQLWRYLRIEIECRQSTIGQIAALGHELRHAVEIADETAAVDRPSIRALYGTIGFAIDGGQRRFESDAAKDAGIRVRRELTSHIQTHSYAVP
jgi:hypothetical protein